MPVPRGEADFRQLDLALLFWPAAPRTRLSGHVEVLPQGQQDYALRADVRNDAGGPVGRRTPARGERARAGRSGATAWRWCRP
jgi:hypothetical protein